MNAFKRKKDSSVGRERMCNNKNDGDDVLDILCILCILVVVQYSVVPCDF